MAGALTKAGRYQIVSELGRGSMGVVYQGFDPVIGRTVAIKTMLIEGLSTSEFEEYKARFQREAQAAGVLGHPNIVTVYDFGEDAGVLFLAMEYLEGKSLQDIVEKQNILPVETIIPMYEQVCSALDHAHVHKIVHRDIKPANIMILDSGLVKVTDFGIAKMMSMGMTQAGQILGTPNYMSPEQVKGRVVDGRSDIFSLGVILYELATGEKPFGGQNITTVIYKIINENPIPPRELDPTVHQGLSYVIQKALAKNPDERYQTCRELAEDLRNYRNLGGTQAPSATVVIKVPSFQTPAPEPRATIPAAEPPRAPAYEPPRTPSPAAVAQRGQISTPTPPISTPAPREQKPARPAPAPVRAVPAPVLKPAPRGTSPAVWIVLILILFAGLGGGGYYYYMTKMTPSATAFGTLNVTTDVQGAKISIDSQTQSDWLSPHSFSNLVAGHHSVSISKEGFQDFQQAVDITEGQTRTLEAKLSPTSAPPGRLEIGANVKGAKISIDDRSDAAWVTPYTVPDLPAGPHTVTVSKDGYESWKQSVSVDSGHTSTLTADLKPAKPEPSGGSALKYGKIIVKSIPLGARVTVDGKSDPEWATPYISPQEWPAGNHTVSVAKEGYEPAQKTLKVEGGRSVEVAFNLKSAGAGPAPTGSGTDNGMTSGVVNVVTAPSGVEVTIDGKSYGLSPVRATLSAGQHTVTAKLPGCLPYEKMIALGGGVIKDLKVSCGQAASAPSGTLEVRTIPPGATIYVDGQAQGQTPKSLHLPAGRHTLTITMTGYRLVRKEVDVPADGTVPIDETLTSQ